MHFQQMRWNMNSGEWQKDDAFTAVSSTQSTTMPAAAAQRYSAQQRNAKPNRLSKGRKQNFLFSAFFVLSGLKLSRKVVPVRLSSKLSSGTM